MYRTTALAELAASWTAASCCYSAVGPSQLGEKFPSPLGVTVPWEPPAVDITLGGDGNVVWLEFNASAYDPGAHDSKGVAAGRYSLGMAPRTNSGWSGDIRRFMQTTIPHEWLPPGEPANGMYGFELYVTDEVAGCVESLEGEHVADFTLAWNCSVERVRWAVGQVPPGPSAQIVLGDLANVLIDNAFAYLVPGTPLVPTAWGPRAKEVYRLLCDHSKKRDRANEHSSVKYYFSASGGTVTMQMQPGPVRQNSAAYVNPAELAPAYTGGRINTAAVAAGGPALGVGSVVTWLAPFQAARNDPEQEYYLQADRTSGGITDAPGVYQAVEAGAPIHAIYDADHFWVSVNVDGCDGFALVRKALVRAQ